MKKETVVLDHNVYIPEGAEELVYSDHYVDDLGLSSDITGGTEEGEEGEEAVGLPVPESFTIVSQSIRTNKDGTQVVDVVAETPDIAGVTKFEIRVTKI